MQEERKRRTYQDSTGYVSKLRGEEFSKVVDDEGLPLVYSQKGIQ